MDSSLKNPMIKTCFSKNFFLKNMNIFKIKSCKAVFYLKFINPLKKKKKSGKIIDVFLTGPAYQECGNWDHPACGFSFLWPLLSRGRFPGAPAVAPASPAGSRRPGAAHRVTPRGDAGGALRCKTRWAEPAEGLPGSGCPTETLICVPWGTSGWDSAGAELSRSQGPLARAAAPSVGHGGRSPAAAAGALPKLSLLCHLLTAMLPIST